MAESMPEFDNDESEMRSLLGNAVPSCPPVHILLAYDEGVLPPEQTQAVQAHLGACRLCQRLLEDLATLPEPQLTAGQFDRIRATLPGQPMEQGRSGRLYPLLAVAAVLLIAALLGFGARYRRAPAPNTAATGSATGSASVSQTKALAEVEIPISPLAPPQTMLQTRGATVDGNPSVTLLMPAFTAYNSGDYEAAATRFTALRSQYPHSDIIALYLGISQLYLQQNEQAYATLTAQSAPAVAADAYQWYTAVAAQRAHSAEAHRLFAHICETPVSAYSAQSCRIERQLR